MLQQNHTGHISSKCECKQLASILSLAGLWGGFCLHVLRAWQALQIPLADDASQQFGTRCGQGITQQSKLGILHMPMHQHNCRR